MAGRPAFLGGVRHYLPEKVELEFSFVIPATKTDAPTVFRDGKASQVSSISAPSSGVWTVTLKDGIVLPQQITSHVVNVAKAATGTDKGSVAYVEGSFSASARTFTLVARDLTDGTTPGTANAGIPTAGARVSVYLAGPGKTSQTDAA